MMKKYSLQFGFLAAIIFLLVTTTASADFSALKGFLGFDSKASVGQSRNTPSDSSIKILPLGDSITQGGLGHPSYRRALWKLLKEAGYDVDFVGSQRTFEGRVAKNLQDFDLDHEGHWGWEAGEIDASLQRWLADYDADIVLLHAGTNDVDRGQSHSSTLNEMTGIINKLRADNPDVTILLAKIIPLRGVDTSAFNAALESWAAGQNTARSPLIIVNQNSDYDPKTDNHDKWHPGSKGEQKMAERWFAALQQVLNLKTSDGLKKGSSHIPSGVEFQKRTLFRPNNNQWGIGDNWCITWAADGSQLTSMDDGHWLNEGGDYHHMLYRINGEADGFSRSRLSAYPEFFRSEPGWFGYGIVSIKDTIYSLVSKTPGPDWSGPFRGMKILKSTDNGNSWYQVNKSGATRLLEAKDFDGRNGISAGDMFFMEEFGLKGHGKTAYPFSWASFVQNGQAGSASPDGYIYVYSPEGAQSNRLLLARAKNEEFEQRSNWEYFQRWDGTIPVWTKDIGQRGSAHEFPDKNSNNEYFGWYSWLPSVVWNPGLGVYVMVNGGTYAGYGMTDSEADYYDKWMHTKTGSLGFWYSENPYGPWQQFYYDEYFIVDDPKNLTYQPKLSPKWISDDGKEMVLIWSDAQKDAKGNSHSVNYRWNQMKIKLIVE